jgi:hypothetical protein
VCLVSLQFASLRLEVEAKEKSAQARRLKNRFGDDAELAMKAAAAGPTGSGAHHHTDQKRPSRMPVAVDPYNPKSGPLPELNMASYAPNSFTLAAYPNLRTPEDFTKGSSLPFLK